MRNEDVTNGLSHFNLGFRATSVAPFDGEVNCGAGGGENATTVNVADSLIAPEVAVITALPGVAEDGILANPFVSIETLPPGVADHVTSEELKLRVDKSLNIPMAA